MSAVDKLTNEVKELGSMNKVALAWALVLTLIVLWMAYPLWKLWWEARKAEKERMCSDPLKRDAVTVNDVNAAAARAPGGRDRHAQEFTGSNQGGVNASLTNAELAGCGAGEHLVSTRGEPDFWEISGELGQYRRGVAARGMKGGNYWSPDLQAWLSAEEVASLPPSQRNQVQYYGDLGAVREVQKLGAATEHLMPSTFAQDNANFALPEERMMAENLIDAEVREYMTDAALSQRLGTY